LEAAEAELVGHLKGLRQEPPQGGAHQVVGLPAIDRLEGRIDRHHDALVISDHEGLVAAPKLFEGGRGAISVWTLRLSRIAAGAGRRPDWSRKNGVVKGSGRPIQRATCPCMGLERS